MSRRFSIHYNTSDSEHIMIEVRTKQNGKTDLKEMHNENGTQIFDDTSKGEMWYRYVLQTPDGYIKERHDRYIPACDNVAIVDFWRSPEMHSDVLRAEAFSNAVFETLNKRDNATKPNKGVLTIQLYDPRIGDDEAFCIVSKQFINWNTDKAFVMNQYNNFLWQCNISDIVLLKEFEFKFGIWDTKNNCFKRYEEGNNKIIKVDPTKQATLVSYNEFNYDKEWRCAGVAVPVFSLRTTKSCGCGEFADLKDLADWCKLAGLKIIQLLPINDTTASLNWRDSYPYNAISVMALHPNYIAVGDVYQYYGKRIASYERETGFFLNDLNYSDYPRVYAWKNKNLKSLFDKNTEAVISDAELQKYLTENSWWLKSYAAFSALRDKYKTANFRNWPEYSKFDSKAVDEFFKPKNKLYNDVMFYVFVQYHLERQLNNAIAYIHSLNIALKGDLPIGINPNSVEAWVEPELFNFGLQAGAPPDFFSRDGQNWGFPTYRWEVMAKNNFAWWEKRLCRMQQFFDAFRIDHILGFFRIWAIPHPFRSGLMGIFSPALPFTEDELRQRGFKMPMSVAGLPSVTRQYLQDQTNEYSQKIETELFDAIDNELVMKQKYFDPQAIDIWLENNVISTSRERLRQILRNILHEVLFVSVKKGEWHPRIMVNETARFARMSESDRQALKSIHDDYFFSRHNKFWQDVATRNLDGMLRKCKMLVCGEDLGMIPASVPVVMQRMQILALELQRMPKFNWDKYGDCSKYQYLSVCATSSHDISGIRGWWEENFNESQWFYNNVMKHEGEAPRVATENIVSEIMQMNLMSPSMLCINPIQDYAGMVDHMPHLYPNEERINQPADTNNQWKYRVPFKIDELAQLYPQLHEKIRFMIEKCERI
ncbi:MAG: 4-alpha-glucanotransferase [Bacteroidales bacterium]|nr:4-alpha-glucanotransferase [Bacteroidales bacterium]